MPRISVCIPTYNYSRYIGVAVRSVLRQTFTDLEVVVVDNASTDDTEAVVHRYAGEDRRIRFYRNNENLGMARNFNRALHLAQADVVKVLCADDYLHPLALERSLEALQSNASVSVVTTGRMLVDTYGRPTGYVTYCGRRMIVPGHNAIDRCVFGTNYVGEPSAVLFRRSLARSGFNESFPHLLDVELWFRLLEQGDLACLPQPLTFVRRHAEQATQDNRRSGTLIEDKQRIFSAYAGKPYVRRTRLRCWMWRARSAYNVWKSDRHSPAMRRFLNPPTFYILLPLMVLADFSQQLASRWRSRVFARTQDTSLTSD